MDHPRLRAIEPIPAEGDRFYLRDPQRFSDTILLVPRATLFVISLFNGKRSIVDIQAEFARATGEILYREKVEQIIKHLDDALFLDNERFASVQARVVRQFHESGSRAAAHAGLSYPAEPAELRKYLGALFEGEDHDGKAGQTGPDDAADIEALIVPHIDLGRGGACYAAAYRELAASCRARRFIVLGICHHPTVRKFAMTRKDYETPFGPVPTDRALVDRLASRCDTDFLADEIAHRDEHSIEFQMLFLRYLFGNFSGMCDAREIVAVPILCSSLQDYAFGGKEPSESGEVAEFLGALREELGSREEECLIAAVDFAHLGRQFGQELDVTDSVASRAEKEDRAMMEQITRRDAAGFFRSIVQERDRRNVCGVPAIYAMLHLLERETSGTARVLRYGQAVDRSGHSIVTFSGIAFYRLPAP